jgi:hypothetical protein
MKSSKQMIVGALVASALALASAYALAQAKPTPAKAPPAASADACPCAKTGECAAGCSCGPCAAGKAGDAGAACPGGACKHDQMSAMDCPMGKLASLSDLKVENTKSGASIQFVAKDTKNLAEVQALAAKVVEKVKSGHCPMMHGAEQHEHGHHHRHMMAPAK